jgi:hypothetical protein
MANPIKGSDGTVFEVTVTEDGAPLDIATATALSLEFLKPSGVVLQKAATLTSGGTDGKMQVALNEAELNEAGLWSIQARFTLGSYTGPTERQSFIVNPGI